MIKIYSDGSSLTNPGIGGWGFVILMDGESFYEGGQAAGKSTNNQMELTAVIKALQTIPITNVPITVISDSKYVVDGASKWMKNWIKKDWRNVKNVEFWKELDDLITNLDVTFEWVRGHSGNRWNEFVDQIAGNAARGVETPLTAGEY